MTCNVLRFLSPCLVMFALLVAVAGAQASDPVVFSGHVKKIIVEKQKVAIKDPETRKRFTVVITEDSRLEGYSGIGDIAKGDRVEGSYRVTDKGLYVVQELSKK